MSEQLKNEHNADEVSNLVTKKWYTAQELLELELPNFPKSRYGIQKRFKRENRLSREVESNNGGGKSGISIEYLITDDKRKSINQLLVKREQKAIIQLAEKSVNDEVSALAKWQRDCAIARIKIG